MPHVQGMVIEKMRVVASRVSPDVAEKLKIQRSLGRGECSTGALDQFDATGGRVSRCERSRPFGRSEQARFSVPPEPPIDGASVSLSSAIE